MDKDFKEKVMLMRKKIGHPYQYIIRALKDADGDVDIAQEILFDKYCLATCRISSDFIEGENRE